MKKPIWIPLVVYGLGLGFTVPIDESTVGTTIRVSDVDCLPWSSNHELSRNLFFFHLFVIVAVAYKS